MIPLQRIVHRDGDRDRNYQSFEDSDNLLSESSPEFSVNLDSLQATSATQTYLLRHWHYSNFAARFALLGIKHKDESSSLTIKPPMRLFWLGGEGIPLETWSKIRLAHWIKDFFNYASFFVCGLEPTILAGLLLHDLSSYSFYPDERCGTSFSSILGGTANNQITWTNHFGSDVLHEAAFWTWTGALLLPPIASYISTFFKDKQRLRWLDISHEVSLDNFFILDRAPSFYNDTFVALYPWSSLQEALAYAKFLILWEGRNHDDNTPIVSYTLKKALVKKLINLANPSRGFPLRFQVLRILAQIAESFHVENIECFIDDPQQGVNLLQLREIILAALKKPSAEQALTFLPINGIQAPIEDSFAEDDQASTPLIGDAQPSNRLNHYFSWTLGETSRPLAPLFFIPSLLSSLYTLYAVGRYLQLIIFKAKDLANHYHAKTNCESSGGSFSFLQQTDRYECVACDWSFVNYQRMFSTQACVEGLLQQKMEPVVLLHHLNQLSNVNEITHIDFSQQEWTNWPVAIWEQILTALQALVNSPLELINFSSAQGDIEPSREHIQVLTRFLTSINAAVFDMSNQVLNDDLINLLLDSLPELNLSELNLVNVGITDVSAAALASLLSNGLQNLNNLQLANNQITDLGLQHISEALLNSSLLILNLAKNPLTDLGLQRLAEGIQHSFVHSLDLSDSKFSPNALKIFSDTLQGNSSLKTLKISNAELVADHISALQNCLQNLEFFDVSNNELDYQAIQLLLKQVQGSHLKSLNIAGNEFTDECASMLAEYLPATSLQHLDISDCELSQLGFSALVKVFPASKLLSFVCKRAELNDHAIIELNSIFSNSNLLLHSINLSDNKITDAALMDLLKVLPNTNLRELYLIRNRISNRLGLAEALSKSNLTLLNMSNNLLDGDFFNELASVLHQSRLQKLILNDNNIAKASLSDFAKELVTVSCHANDLNATQLSRQAKRVFYPMQSDTQLTELNIIHDNLDESSIRSFCRVASSLPNIHFLKHDELQPLDWRTCEMLPTNTVPTVPVVRLGQTNVSESNSSPRLKETLVLGSPFLISLLCAGGILCFMALLYGGYRASRSTYRFFRPAPSRMPLIDTDAEINNENLRPFSAP